MPDLQSKRCKAGACGKGTPSMALPQPNIASISDSCRNCLCSKKKPCWKLWLTASSSSKATVSSNPHTNLLSSFPLTTQLARPRSTAPLTGSPVVENTLLWLAAEIFAYARPWPAPAHHGFWFARALAFRPMQIQPIVPSPREVSARHPPERAWRAQPQHAVLCLHECGCNACDGPIPGH